MDIHLNMNEGEFYSPSKNKLISQNRGMFQVVMDLKDHLVPIPHRGQGHLLLEQFTQSFSHLGIEHFQWCGIHSLYLI